MRRFGSSSPTLAERRVAVLDEYEKALKAADDAHNACARLDRVMLQALGALPAEGDDRGDIDRARSLVSDATNVDLTAFRTAIRTARGLVAYALERQAKPATLTAPGPTPSDR